MTSENSCFNRRKFLQALFACSAALPFPLILYAGDRASQEPRLPIDLSFADKNGVGPELDAPFVEENLIPLHPEISLSIDPGSEKSLHALSALKAEFSATGDDWREDFSLSWSFQHYGVPGKGDVCDKLIDYCHTTKEYLYGNLSGLDNVNFQWHTLENRTDVRDSHGNHILAGKHTYFVVRVNVVDSVGAVQQPYLINATPVNRALHYISNSDHGVKNADRSLPTRRMIYLIPGATSLVSPFSEILHMSTHAAAMRHAEDLSQLYDINTAKALAKNSGETITESAAVLTAMKFLSSYDESNREKQVIRHARSLANQLPDFSQSISYMLKYGVQAALDSYQEDPSGFMNLIRKA